MKYVIAFLVLLATGCRVSVQHPKGVKPRTYTYWFSRQQRTALDSLMGIDGPQKIEAHYTVNVNGKDAEYTECTAGTSLPFGRFTDYKRVAKIAGQPCQSW